MDNKKIEFNIEEYFKSIKDVEKSSAIATLKTLIKFLDQDTSITAVGLRNNVRSAIDQLIEIDCSTEVESVAEIYFRFITLSASSFDVSNIFLTFIFSSYFNFRNSMLSNRNCLGEVIYI